jgi:hypothetical protein
MHQRTFFCSDDPSPLVGDMLAFSIHRTDTEAPCPAFMLTYIYKTDICIYIKVTYKVRASYGDACNNPKGTIV